MNDERRTMIGKTIAWSNKIDHSIWFGSVRFKTLDLVIGTGNLDPKMALDTKRALELHALVIGDTTVLGGDATLKKAQTLVQSIGVLSLHVSKIETNTLDLAICPDVIKAIHQVFIKIARSKRPCFLLIYINGHSKLWHGAEALQTARDLGQKELVAQDQENLRFSSLMHDGKVVLSPIDMKDILTSIPACVQRSLLFLDTCHSMSLVSVLLCPPIALRIVHSTGESERTWQTREGSVMAVSWLKACENLIDETRRVNRKQRLENLNTAFWDATQRVAADVKIQVLTTGPADAYAFF